MGSIGASVRRAFGPYERQVSELYRRVFIDLENLADCIQDWADPTAICEIGCGEGALAERLCRDFPDASYLGIDIAPQLGRMYDGDRAEFRQIDAQDLAEERSGQFDLVVLNDVMHHVPVGIRADILQAAKKLLVPGGVLVFKDWLRRSTPFTRPAMWPTSISVATRTSPTWPWKRTGADRFGVRARSGRGGAIDQTLVSEPRLQGCQIGHWG